MSTALPGRSALVLGNVGKLGHELLNVVLERPEYARVAVGVRRPLRVVVHIIGAARLRALVGDPLEGKRAF